jgi:hypothetical protein
MRNLIKLHIWRICLNISVQRNNSSIIDLYEKIKSFSNKDGFIVVKAKRKEDIYVYNSGCSL